VTMTMVGVTAIWNEDNPVEVSRKGLVSLCETDTGSARLSNAYAGS
jgi:hypothetical protein